MNHSSRIYHDIINFIVRFNKISLVFNDPRVCNIYYATVSTGLKLDNFDVS